MAVGAGQQDRVGVRHRRNIPRPTHPKWGYAGFAPVRDAMQIIPNDVLDEMARYSTERWPTLPTTIRVQPTKIAEHAAGYAQPWPEWRWQYLDTAWAQYSSRKGPIAEYAVAEAAEAGQQGLGLVVGLNVLTGGDGSSGIAGPGKYADKWAMSADELGAYGSALIAEPHACTFTMWTMRYDNTTTYEYFTRPGISAAVSELSQQAATRPSMTCSPRDTVTITDNEPRSLVDVRVGASSDDGEERASGNMYLMSSDLELTFDDGGDQTVGMRFLGITVPQGATISSAHLQFQVDEVNTGTTDLTIAGEASDDALTFTSSSGNITSRTTTAASVTWSPPPWTTKGEAGAAQQTSDIATVIQEIVNRPGWQSGNSLVLIIAGTGERTAESFDGDATGAPLLHIEYVAP